GTRRASTTPQLASSAATTNAATATIRDRAGSGTPAASSPRPATLPSTDQLNSTQVTPSRVSPTAPAGSDCRGPWPRNISTGSVAKHSPASTLPSTVTGAGH